MPIKIVSGKVGDLSADVKFVAANCYMPDQLIPCTENTDGYLRFTNNGDPDQCCIIYQIKGENFLLWEGQMETGETIDIGIIAHFPPEDYPVTEVVTVNFIAGYKISEFEMIPTDQISFDILIYVEQIDWVMYAIIGGVAIGSVGILYAIMKRTPAPVART